MANESGENKTTTSSSSSSSADSYIGSLISLTSKYEIRYEGVLYFLNPQDSTLGLTNVRSYGTEGRKKDGPQIPPSDKVYEYILFRGCDIKDLQVKTSAPSQVEGLIPNDPAIIQSQCAAGPSNLSKPPVVSVVALNEPSPNKEASIPNTRSFSNVLPAHQSGPQVGPWYPSQTIQKANSSSYAMPINWPGYNIATTDNALQQPLPSTSTSLSTLQNYWQASPPQASMIPLTSSSYSHSPIPALTTSNTGHSSIIPILNSEQLSTHTTDVLSSLSMKSSTPLYPVVLPTNQTNMSLFPSSGQNGTKIDAPSITNVFSNPVTLHPSQPLSYSAPSIVDSTSGPLLKQSPLLLTPDQFSRPNLSDLSPTQNIYPDHMGVINSASSNFSSSNNAPEVQPPLLPLQPSAQQFTEEFDFEAMNEKFKKDEVWGYLGKAMQREKMEKIEDNATVCQTTGNEEHDGSALEADSRPAYNKDEFFDTISCNSTSRRVRNGQNRFSDRMKQDTETFGTFQQRTHPGYGGYGVGRGVIREHNSYYWGRGYNSRGRVRGGYVQF